MKTRVWTLGLLVLVGALLLGPPRGEAAGKYPSKTIVWVVPFAAGGGADTMGRILSTGALDYFGVPFHVRNIPGASGVVGWKWILNRPADGYTIYQGANTQVISLLREDKPPISYKRIKMVCYLSYFVSVLYSKPGKPWATWEGFKAEAKKRPGKITVSGTYSTLMGAAYMLDQAGIKVKFVPYPSTAGALADYVGGHVDMTVGSVASGLKVMPDQAVPVVNMSNEVIKHKLFKGIPNATDLGYEGMTFPRWVGVRPGTPDKVVDIIAKKIEKMLKDKSVSRLLKRVGEDIAFLPREKARAQYEKEVKMLKKAVKLLK